MIRFPIKAGSASAATSLTIACATFAEVIAGIDIPPLFRQTKRGAPPTAAHKAIPSTLLPQTKKPSAPAEGPKDNTL
jgi:hypothetical protein